MTKYQCNRRDFEYLETLAELDDQVDLDSDRLELMQNPTKSKAAAMYHSAIVFWFQQHGTRFDFDPIVKKLRKRHV